MSDLADLLTPAMTRAELAEWLEINRNLVPIWLDQIEGLEFIGNRVRVPLRRMPVTYLVSVGAIDPAAESKSLANAIGCHRLHETSGRSAVAADNRTT